MKIALCQLDTTSLGVEEALLGAERLLAQVDADIYILPEMFATGYSVVASEVAEPSGGTIQTWLRCQSQQRGAAVVATVAVEERGSYFNRLFFATPSGDMFSYDKRHLFTFAGEDRHFSAGRERIVVDYGGFRVLPLVCYDLRFPAWSYLPNQVDLIIYSASWADSRMGAWDALLPARAIENQAFVVGVNRVGHDKDGTYFSGHTACYDFMGRKVAEVPSGQQGVVVVEVAMEAVSRFRDKFRAWQDADRIEIFD